MREKPKGRWFDPTPLREVPELELSINGAIGITQSGGRIINVHHANHPETRFRGTNALSLGFASHLERMAARIGDHFVPGCAGENIIIARPVVHSIEAFAGTTFILVGVTKTEPLRELVWDPRKDPDYERKEIHHRAEDPHIA